MHPDKLENMIPSAYKLNSARLENIMPTHIYISYLDIILFPSIRKSKDLSLDLSL